MTDDQFVIHFENALLERVSIHKKSRVWQFNIKLENPLPVNDIQFFHNVLKKHLQQLQ